MDLVWDDFQYLVVRSQEVEPCKFDCWRRMVIVAAQGLGWSSREAAGERAAAGWLVRIRECPFLTNRPRVRVRAGIHVL